MSLEILHVKESAVLQGMPCFVHSTALQELTQESLAKLVHWRARQVDNAQTELFSPGDVILNIPR